MLYNTCDARSDRRCLQHLMYHVRRIMCDMYMYKRTCAYTYIYIYMYREREIDGERERDRERDIIYICMYIHMAVCHVKRGRPHAIAFSHRTRGYGRGWETWFEAGRGTSMACGCPPYKQKPFTLCWHDP